MIRLFETGCSPRESFERFPAWPQPLITFICGKPSRNEQLWFQVGPVVAILFDLLKFASGIGSSFVLMAAGGYWQLAIPLCWVLTVNAIRSLTSDAHYAGHSCVTGKRGIDHVLGELLSTLVLSTNMTAYASGHNTRHHGAVGIGTLDDPDIEMLYLMGFKMGRPIRWYWYRLWLSIVSPRYHLLYAWNRVRSNFISAPFLRAVLTWIIHGFMLAIVLHYGVWREWIIAWVIPAIPLVAISAALQFPSEHLWLMPRMPNESNRGFLRRISHGRFFLVAAPRADLSLPVKIIAWSCWCVAMIQPLFERFFVCVSVLPAHDYHHRRPRIANWPMEPYCRQRDINSGNGEYREFYGLVPAFLALFVVWSRLDPELIQERFSFLGLVDARGKTCD